MALVAGVDSSTQGCKVVVANAETGEVVSQARRRHPVGTEVDPEFWLTALQECIAELNHLEGVSAISIAGQQHGLVCLNHKGEVIRPALLWNDTRSASSAADLISEIGGPEVYAQRVGIVPVASFTASKLRWVRDNEPENAQQIAAVCLPHDWLTWRLMGYGPQNPNLDALVTDRSDASGTAYWSGETNQYDTLLFQHALGREMRVAGEEGPKSSVVVPKVLGCSQKAGYFGQLVVGPGAGDNAGGALGLGVSESDIVVSLGTSGAAFSPQSETLGKGDPSGIVAGFSNASGTHLPLVCTLNGARVLESASKLLNLGSDGLDLLVPLALSAPPGSGGLVLLPYFEGERTPNLPTAKASLHNMTLTNSTAANLARAHIEGLLCSMAQAVNAINQQSTVKVKKHRVLLIGGAAANTAVQEIAATIFNVEFVEVPEKAEYVAQGAALQAAWVLTGTKPEWKVPVAKQIKCQLDQRILDQYETVQSRVYPLH